MVDETRISKPQEYTDTFKQNLTCIFLSVRGILKETFQCETPCSFSANPINKIVFLTGNYLYENSSSWILVCTKGRLISKADLKNFI